MTRIRLTLAVLAALACAAIGPATAGAAAPGLSDPVDQWLPSSDGATLTYRWSNSAYAPASTLEQYKVSKRTGPSFNVDWTTEDLGNGEDAQTSVGTMGFNRSESGLINTGWSSTPPPPQFPILCANASGCGNSMSSVFFMVIWGTRGPVLQEPLLRGTTWNSVGGANNDVASENRYLGTEQISVPAFPSGVTAVKVRSDVTQAGAIGDPYGSGVRTVWWVRGVGPVRVLFRHAGGETSQAELVGTNLGVKDPPADTDYLPFRTGDKQVFRWRNSKHMRRPSTQELSVAQVVNNTARVDVKQRSGPIKVVGSYVFASRLGGTTNIAASTRAATLERLPPLGPRSQPAAKRRRFFTPYDLMTYGFNPVLVAYAKKGDTWKSKKGSRDFSVFGVVGSSEVVGVEKIKTPAGRFNALHVKSGLVQRGFRFGSGTRDMWFAPGKGLVKLVFKHRDGSVSTVDRIR